MDAARDEPDVLGKIDALLTRHRTGAPTQQDIASAEAQAARAAIPVLTEIIDEDRAIPVLTEVAPATKANEPASAGGPVADDLLDDAALRQIEESLVRELENRIELEFTAALDRALNELLDQTREHLRHAVREALRQRPGTLPRSPGED